MISAYGYLFLTSLTVWLIWTEFQVGHFDWSHIWPFERNFGITIENFLNSDLLLCYTLPGLPLRSPLRRSEFVWGPRVPRDVVLDDCPHLEFMIPPRIVVRPSPHCSWTQDTFPARMSEDTSLHLINFRTSTTIQFHHRSFNLRSSLLKLLLALDLGLK